jgi:Zn-dependent protease with chaperone function
MQIKDYSGAAKLYSESKVGLESVDFQYNIGFHKELVAAVKILVENRTKKDAVKKSRIVEIVKERLNMAIELEVVPNWEGGAAVDVPKLNKDHVLIAEFTRNGLEDKDSEEILKGLKDKSFFEGGYNLENSTLSGTFSKIKSRVFVGLPLLEPSAGYSPEEIAAILTHEFGHVYYYFVLASSTVTTNLAMKAASDRMTGAKSKEMRILIAKDVEKALGVEYPNTDIKDVKTLQTMTMAAVAGKSRSELGENIYDYTGYEALADQFAARHGFAVPLATGLDRLQRRYGHAQYRTNVTHIMMEALKLGLFMGSVVGFLGLPLIILFTGLTPSLYDKPKERVDRIRNDLVVALKNKDLDEEYRTALLNDIEVIDKLQSKVGENETLFELYWKHVHPSGRSKVKHTELQQELEALASNELYVAAATLSNI